MTTVTRKSIADLSASCVAVGVNATVVAIVPQIIIKTGFIRPDGQEEVLADYICDVPGCPNVATQVLGHA